MIRACGSDRGSPGILGLRGGRKNQKEENQKEENQKRKKQEEKIKKEKKQKHVEDNSLYFIFKNIKNKARKGVEPISTTD